jgi:hypothetical protein
MAHGALELSLAAHGFGGRTRPIKAAGEHGPFAPLRLELDPKRSRLAIHGGSHGASELAS